MTADTKLIKVFYSYSHKDDKLRDKLETHLSTLRREGVIQEWHDRRITAGREWEQEIDQQLEAAQLILLLISPDFIASDYCYSREMQRALQRHEAGTARVVPIILRPAGWESTPFSKLKCLPLDGKPVMKWTNRDEAFLDIVNGIRQTITELRSAASKPGKPKPPAAPPRPELRTAYLRLMIADWRTLPLEALDPDAVDATARRLSLEQVYVALDTTTPRAERGREISELLGQEKPLSAVEALCQAPQGRMVLLGQPGSGKSTFARYLALTLAEALLQPRKVLLSQRLPGWRGKAHLPVFIPLRLLATSLPDKASQGTAGQVEIFVRNLVDGREKLTGFGEPLLAALQNPGGLVIFDGLDEVPSQQRLLLRQALSEFAELYPRCTVLVTCRVHSYRQDPAWQLEWAAEHTLAEFDNDKIEHFIDAWYGALAALPGSRIDYLGKKARTLKVALGPDDPRGLWALAGTPLLLTVMAIVHAQKSLPDSRVGVYRECVDILLMRWQGAKEGNVRRPPLLEALAPYNVSALKVHQGLREIAYRAHWSGERDRLGGSRALVSDFIIRGVMHRRLGAEGLELFLDYCRHANGLLLADRVIASRVDDTEAVYVFPHLSFEEYLAALYLLQMNGSGIKEAVTRAGDMTWWEVVRFMGEYLCHDDQGGNPFLAKTLLDALCPALKTAVNDSDWRRVWLAGVLLPGWQREAIDRDSVLEQRIIDRLVTLLQTPTALQNEPVARVAVGRALALLGDPRPGVGLQASLPNIQWVRIPGTTTVQAKGQFPNFTGLRLGMGAGPDPDAESDEKWPANAKLIEIADFELAAYPLTVAQFRPFVEQSGYQENRYWSRRGLEWRNRLGWNIFENQREPVGMSNLANYPVVGISWYEAEAYCKWLNDKLGLPPGTIRLPTEAEWEWASRGPEGKRYAWEENWTTWYCDQGRLGMSGIRVVGIFPSSAVNWWERIWPDSGAVYDLIGNVFEWTASEYSPNYDKANQSLLNTNHYGNLVIRGCSGFYDSWRMRAAKRDVDKAELQSLNRGIRLAKSRAN